VGISGIRGLPGDDGSVFYVDYLKNPGDLGEDGDIGLNGNFFHRNSHFYL
jgi:hypothetical protein